MRGTGAAAEWLDRLDRIGSRQSLTLILAVLAKVKDDGSRVSVLKALERYTFVSRLLNYSYYFYPTTREAFVKEAVLLYRDKIDVKSVVARIHDATSKLADNPAYLLEVRKKFRSNGFYTWPLIKYFLFEYDQDLRVRSKTERAKIDWDVFLESASDFSSVEHIFPQRPRDQYWRARFGNFSPKQSSMLRNSLGNLLPLSKPKNSSLSNRAFPEKVDGRGDSSVGYRYGCYAENEVTKEREWTPVAIRKRGLRMIAFMERRWAVKMGNEEDQLHMLGVEFARDSLAP